MAKLILPLMSLEAHGKIGIGITFATNKWGQYVKFVPLKRHLDTAAQRKVKHAYGQIATEWRALTPAQRATYHAAAVKAGHTDCNQHFHQRWPVVYTP